MQTEFTALVKKDGAWWLGWIEERPGVNAQEKNKKQLLLSIKEATKNILDNRQAAIKEAEGNFEEIPLLI